MRILLGGLVGLVAAVGLAASAQASINYNASKSNTGNLTYHRHHHASRIGLGHGAHAGKRSHQPLRLAHDIKPKHDATAGAVTGRRQH